MTQLSESKYVELRQDEIQYTGSFKISVWTIVCRGRKYVLIYGKKLSTNFFVNVYYILTRGACREIKLIPFPNYTSSLTSTRYVFNWRAAKRFFNNLSSLKEN